MKKTLLLLISLSLMVALQSCGSLTSGDDDGGGGSGSEKWTYMVYVAGTNSLSTFAATDLAEMQSVGSNSDLAIVVQYENYEEWTKRYYLAEDEDDNVEIDLCSEEPDTCTYVDDELYDDVDMGDPASLTDFVEWAVGAYPATNYILVLWDHGSGWRNDGTSAPALLKGALQDEYAGSYMSVPGIAEAIADAETSTGETIDIVRFDACLMGMYEVAYELKDVTDYLVASEETVQGDGDPYDTILADLKDDPDMTPAELAAFMVESYDESYDGVLDVYGDQVGTTNSAIDMSKVEALNTTVTALAATLSNDLDTAQDAATATQSFSTSVDGDSHDLYDFAAYLVENSGDADVVAAAEAVQTAVEDAVTSFLNNGDSVADSHGIAIYLPGSLQETCDDESSYGELACNDQEGLTTWGDFVGEDSLWPGLCEDL